MIVNDWKQDNHEFRKKLLDAVTGGLDLAENEILQAGYTGLMIEDCGAMQSTRSSIRMINEEHQPLVHRLRLCLNLNSQDRERKNRDE
jgi:hypothetical protein